MATTFHRRAAPCCRCGDVVLIGEVGALKMFGLDLRMKPKIRLQHADPSTDGEIFDPVDEGCRRVTAAR
ncbi:MAG TPA: hypothetical protein VHO01_11385 [Jatrophihabitans sp.]|nr:hypothetical protein [Jatrophihabitans sp.]